ncbi:MAG: sel1 repeat family protein [Verrucomicrobia bacterium]|nr:sel1 repeat family protein [Verrucomicrobiota bacterium]
MMHYDEISGVFCVSHTADTLDQIEVLLRKTQADCDDVDSQFHLGCRQIRICNMTWNDLTEAGGWFRKAAERGYPPAQFALGLMCSEGAGVPVDVIESYQWLELSSNRKWGLETKPGIGAQEAAQAIRTIAARMTSDQIAEAKRRSQVFVPRHVSEPQ